MNKNNENQKNRITTILFDVGGVLVVDYVDNKILDLAKKYDKDPERMLQLRRECRILADKGWISDKEFWQKVLEAVNIKAVEEDWEFESYEKKLSGGFEIVERLKQKGYFMAILSNDSKQSSDYRKQKYNLDSLFNDTIFSYQYGIIKPDLKFFEIALNKLNVTAEQTLFIDDRLENINASRNVGIHSIYFRSSEQLSRELAKLGIL